MIRDLKWSNLLNFELDNFKLKDWSFFYITLKQSYNNFTVSFEKPEIVSFPSPIIKTLLHLLLCFHFQHLIFVVSLNLLQLVYNIPWNMDNLVSNQFCNHHLDQLQFYECYHVFKSVFTGSSINHSIIIFYLYSWKIISFVTLSTILIFKW